MEQQILLDRFNKTFALVLNGGDVAKLPIEDQIDRVRNKTSTSSRV